MDFTQIFPDQGVLGGVAALALTGVVYLGRLAFKGKDDALNLQREHSAELRTLTEKMISTTDALARSQEQSSQAIRQNTEALTNALRRK